MTALSLAGLLASLAPAVITAWRDPVRDLEGLLACLGTLALVRFPVSVSARPRALLVHSVWGIVAVLLLRPAAVHAIRFLRKPQALDLVLA